jgi:uncharacterized protein (DUF58 family)
VSRLLVPPTALGTISLLFTVMLGAISLRAANPWLLAVACALVAPVVLSQLMRPDLKAVSVRFRSRERVGVGEAMDHSFVATNDGRRSLPACRLTHALDGFDPVSLAVPPLPPGGCAEVSVRRTALARGVAREHRVALLTAAPFGMAQHRRALSVTAQISIHPAPAPVATLVGEAHGELVTGRPTRSGPDPHGLREWRRGDERRQVHWRATARHDRLTVVIPEATVQTRLALVVGGSPHDERWEDLLATAAWTAVEAARGQGEVRLAAGGVASYQGGDPGAVLDWFAALRFVPEASAPVLSEAVRWVGADGLVLLATTRPAGERANLRGVVPLVP